MMIFYVFFTKYRNSTICFIISDLGNNGSLLIILSGKICVEDVKITISQTFFRGFGAVRSHLVNCFIFTTSTPILTALARPDHCRAGSIRQCPAAGCLCFQSALR